MARTVNKTLRDERKRLILQAAASLFSEQGFDRTTISQIAKQSGISHATVFLYFKSKEALFHFVITENLEKAKDIYQGILLHSEHITDALRLLVSRQIHIALRTSTFLRLVQYIVGQPHHFLELTEKLDQFMNEFVSSLIPIIKRGQQQKLLAPADPEFVAKSYFSYLNGVGLCIREEIDENKIEQLVRNGLRIFGL